MFLLSCVQLYDFVSEDSPCSVAFHPGEQIFSCGFSSGMVRVFAISSAKLLADHKYVLTTPESAPVAVKKLFPFICIYFYTGSTEVKWWVLPFLQTASSCTAPTHRGLWHFITPLRKSTVSSKLCVCIQTTTSSYS